MLLGVIFYDLAVGTKGLALGKLQIHRRLSKEMVWEWFFHGFPSKCRLTPSSSLPGNRMFQNLWRRNCKEKNSLLVVPYGRIFFGSSNEWPPVRNCHSPPGRELQSAYWAELCPRRPQKVWRARTKQCSPAMLQVGISKVSYSIFTTWLNWMGCHLTVNLTTCPKNQFNLSPNMFWQDHTGQSNLHHTKTKKCQRIMSLSCEMALQAKANSSANLDFLVVTLKWGYHSKPLNPLKTNMAI